MKPRVQLSSSEKPQLSRLLCTSQSLFFLLTTAESFSSECDNLRYYFLPLCWATLAADSHPSILVHSISVIKVMKSWCVAHFYATWGGYQVIPGHEAKV